MKRDGFISIINIEFHVKKKDFQVFTLTILYPPTTPDTHKVTASVHDHFIDLFHQFIPEINTFKTMHKPDLLILNTKLYCLSKLHFHLPRSGIILVVP